MDTDLKMYIAIVIFLCIQRIIVYVIDDIKFCTTTKESLKINKGDIITLIMFICMFICAVWYCNMYIN